MKDSKTKSVLVTIITSTAQEDLIDHIIHLPWFQNAFLNLFNK